MHLGDWLQPQAQCVVISCPGCCLDCCRMCKTKIPVSAAGLLSLKTLLCKLVGVCFSMAGGLIAGKEGPFVHSGLPLCCCRPAEAMTCCQLHTLQCMLVNSLAGHRS